MDTVRANSPAKINLTLAVGPLREDGFHAIDSIVARIDLADEITITPIAEPRWTLTCDDLSIPTDESNLILQAVRALVDRVPGLPPTHMPGLDIALAKRIPAGAGLGGGSSNAATTLMLLNQLWRLDLSSERLAEIGAEIGSDVPLFFASPLCRMTGRGEKVESIDAVLSAWVTLILPGIHCATGRVYRAFDERNPSPTLKSNDDVVALLRGVGGANLADSGGAAPRMAATGALELLDAALFNDLRKPAEAAYPELEILRASLTGALRCDVHLTGSGSTLFTLHATRADADQVADLVQSQFAECRVVVAPLDRR